MKLTEWVLIDTETTGIRSDDWVIEVCVQQMLGWSPKGPPKSWLIRAPHPVGSRAFRIHGISNAELARSGEVPAEAHAEIIDYIDRRPYGAFNLPFDRRMLIADWDRLKVAQKKRPVDALCALRLSRLFVSESPGHSLDAIADHLSLRFKPKHRAKHDVKATVELLQWHISRRAGEVAFGDLTELCKIGINDARRLVQLKARGSQPIKTR